MCMSVVQRQVPWSNRSPVPDTPMRIPRLSPPSTYYSSLDGASLLRQIPGVSVESPNRRSRSLRQLYYYHTDDLSNSLTVNAKSDTEFAPEV